MVCTNCNAQLETSATYCGFCGRNVRTRRDTLVGTVLDHRYQIDARIAAGGFGAIYRATDLSNGQVLALKVLHAELAGDAQLAARFRREGAALSNLTSPHTIATSDVGEATDGTLYIAMELLRGESLLDRFRREGAMPWRRVVAIIRAICDSLAEAHALGIVHRDLKPGNIHLEHVDGNPDFVKVFDFGIAKVMRGSSSDLGEELTLAGQAIGTLEYMSPEQLVGTECDGRTDIYTLGVVAYELLTGMRPFADATGPTSLITALLVRSPAPPSAVSALPVPAELDAILLRCLERDVDDRYATVDELAAALDELVASHPRPVAELAHSRFAFESDLDDEPTWINGEAVISRSEIENIDAAPPTTPDALGPVGYRPSSGVHRLPLAPSSSPSSPGVAMIAPTVWQSPAFAPLPVEPVRSIEPAALQPFAFDVRGTSADAPPLPTPAPRLGVAKVLIWGVSLLVSGLGIGMLLASLA